MSTWIEAMLQGEEEAMQEARAADRAEAMEQALIWIEKVADQLYESPKLRSDDARQVKRIADRAAKALGRDT